MASNELVIKITGDAKNFKGSLKEATSATEDFNLSLGAIAGLAATAFAAVTAAIYTSVMAYKESEEAANLLTNALQNQGLYSKELVANYKQQAEELQKLTGIDDDAITKGQAQIQAMIGRTKVTKEMTEAAVNLGARMGGDASAGFEALGRAMNGNTRQLKQLGIEIDENLTREERTKQILEKVSVAYGGLAASQNQGLGSMKGLKTAIGNLAEDFGELLAPSVTKATKIMTVFFQTLHDSYQKSKEPVNSLENQILSLEATLKGLEAGQKRVGRFFSPSDVEDVKAVSAQLEILKAQREELRKGMPGGTGQDKEKDEAARRAEANRIANEAREMTALRAHNKATELELEGHTKQVLDLAREEAKTLSMIADSKNVSIREKLREHLEEVRQKKYDAEYTELEQQRSFNEQYLALQAEFGALSADQRRIFEEETSLNLQSKMLNENEAQALFYRQQIESETASNNQRLVNQVKFGKAWAAINQTMNSEQVAGAKTLFGELAAMQQSGNSTLKSIGKAAALANIVIKTAEGATAAYAGAISFFGPVLGPPIGIAAAGALTAYGAEQTGKIMAAAQGGLITGGIPGVDSVPVLAQSGEIVTPAQNFEEVVGSVAARRLAEEQGGAGGAMSVDVTIGFTDNAMELIERKLIERSRNGVSLLTGLT